MIIDSSFFDGDDVYDSGAGRWLTANGSATATSNGYSAVNVRIKFCQHEHGGQFMRKRYLKAVIPFESDIRIVADMTLRSDARDTFLAGGVKTQTRRFDTGDFTPADTGENINVAKFGFNFVTGDVFTELQGGPELTEGYQPFKFYRADYFAKVMGLRGR